MTVLIITMLWKPGKGTTVAGHALSKHAGRNPKIWDKTTGSAKNWNDQAMEYFNDIIDGSGSFNKVTNKKGIVV